MKEIIINGGLRSKGQDIVLTLYSTPLARIFIHQKIKSVNVLYKQGVFVVNPGHQRSISIERKERQPLMVLYVGKFLPKELLASLRDKKRQKKVKIIVKGVATKSDLLPYNKQISYTEIPNLDTTICESEKIKVGCYISCHKNKIGFNYRLNIRHRMLEEIAIKKEIVAVGRNQQGNFILRNDKRGRHFNFYKSKQGHPLAYMQISPSLITEEENKLFQAGRKAVSNRVYLSGKEFKLDISRFFSTKDEKELAYALLQRGINVRIPEMHKREADIVLKDSGVQIEVTQLKPKKNKSSQNSPHTTGVHINARLSEGYVRVTKNMAPLYFVVFNGSWKKYKWVTDLVKMVEPHVKCISTNFEPNWEDNVANTIKSVLTKRGILK
ncbi:MAG: hypothetical protein V1914_03505 [archaeon]